MLVAVVPLGLDGSSSSAFNSEVLSDNPSKWVASLDENMSADASTGVFWIGSDGLFASRFLAWAGVRLSLSSVI